MTTTILFVDDEPALLEAIERVLFEEPYNVLTAPSGQKGLELLATEPIDIVVSDEMMPAMTGSEFLSHVRRDYPQTVRILLTGHANIEAAMRAINEGEIFRFLTKPCPPELLIGTLGKAVETQQLYREAHRLASMARQRSQALNQLERENPGISDVQRNEDGAIVVPEADIDPVSLRSEIDAAIAAFSQQSED